VFNQGDPIWFEVKPGQIVKGTVTGKFGPCYLAMYSGDTYMVPPHEARQEEDTVLDSGSYYCKGCGDPVERAIEGELICADCWNLAEMSEAEAVADRQMREYLAWASCHCESCKKELRGGGVCPECQAERDEIERALGWEE